MVELASVIFALSMGVREDIILAWPLKAISRDKTARLGFHGFMTAKKLHYFT